MRAAAIAASTFQRVSWTLGEARRIGHRSSPGGLAHMPHRRVFFTLAGRLRDPAQSIACKELPIPPPFPRLRCSDLSVGQPFRRYKASKKEIKCLQAVTIDY